MMLAFKNLLFLIILMLKIILKIANYGFISQVFLSGEGFVVQFTTTKLKI